MSVSDHLCPLDIRKPFFLHLRHLPLYTRTHIWDVYAELQKIKPSKAFGPDGIPQKLVKEFSYELSTPLTDLSNSSYSKRVVPKWWKRAVVNPIPKTNPPREDKLRPVSLTGCESFVTNVVLEYVSDKIDTQQLKGVSTSHYLASNFRISFEFSPLRC